MLQSLRADRKQDVRNNSLAGSTTTGNTEIPGLLARLGRNWESQQRSRIRGSWSATIHQPDTSYRLLAAKIQRLHHNMQINLKLQLNLMNKNLSALAHSLYGPRNTTTWLHKPITFGLAHHSYYQRSSDKRYR